MLLETNKEKPNFVVLALNCYSKVGDIQALNHFGISRFKAVQGKYKGQKENAYIVPFNTVEQLQHIIFVARHFNQEAVLVVDKNRVAELVHLDNSNKSMMPEVIGKFQCVSSFEAEVSQNYVYDETRDCYYIAK